MLTTAKLKELEELATLFYSISECAIILQVSKAKLKARIENEATPEAKHYNRGLLLSEKEVREKIIEMANRGSTKAQSQVMELIKNVKLENDEEAN